MSNRRRRRPALHRDLFERLQMVEPSRHCGIEYRACSVRLKEGSVEPRVYVQEAEPWFDFWGVDPEDDTGKRVISVEDVADLAESADRIAPALATRMYEAGESGMGYCVFQLVLLDGRRLDCLTGNAVDFIDWPPQVDPTMVVDLIPHGGQARTSVDSRVHGADFAWCLYDGVA